METAMGFYYEYLDRKHWLGELWLSVSFYQSFGIERGG